MSRHTVCDNNRGEMHMILILSPFIERLQYVDPYRHGLRLSSIDRSQPDK